MHSTYPLFSTVGLPHSLFTRRPAINIFSGVCREEASGAPHYTAIYIEYYSTAPQSLSTAAHTADNETATPNDDLIHRAIQVFLIIITPHINTFLSLHTPRAVPRHQRVWAFLIARRASRRKGRSRTGIRAWPARRRRASRGRIARLSASSPSACGC